MQRRERVEAIGAASPSHLCSAQAAWLTHVVPWAGRPDGARTLISDVATILERQAQRARATVGVRDVGRQRSANGPPAESDPARRRKAPFRLRHGTPFPCCCCWRAGSLKRPLFPGCPRKPACRNAAGICGPPAQYISGGRRAFSPLLTRLSRKAGLCHRRAGLSERAILPCLPTDHGWTPESSSRGQSSAATKSEDKQ